MAEAATREMGKPYKETANEAHWTAGAFDYYAEISRHEAGRVVGPLVESDINVITKHPLGVVGIILPFNFPFVLFGWEAGAALGAGNAVIMKPSELTSFSSLIMMECFDHLPKGLMQCIPGAFESGMTWINAAALLDNGALPFGGRKMSGTGRQMGLEGLDQFRHTKFTIIEHENKPADFWWFPYQDAEAYPG